MKLTTCISFTFLLCLYSCVNDKGKKVLKLYYDNGNVSDEMEYIMAGKDTIKEGYCNTYYRSGKKRTIRFYASNRLEGIGIDYFFNGSKATETRYSRDEKVGPEICYYHNGAIEQYKLYNHISKLRLIIRYDSLGAFINKEGRLIASTLAHVNDCDSIQVNDTVSGEMIIAEPYGCKTKVSITEEVNGKKTKSYSVALKENYAKFRIICSEPGIHRVIKNALVDDTIHNERFTDVDTSVFRVIEPR